MAGQHRVQQLPGLRLGQAAYPQRSQTSQLRHLFDIVRGEHQRHRLRHQPAGGERQRLRRGPIQPLRVVDHTHQRPLGRRIGQQTQHSQTDQEPIRFGPGGQPERGAQCLPLRVGQPFGAIEQRRTHLVQPAEGQLHLRLDTRGAQHPAARRLSDKVVQQRRLAHARLADQHQCPTLAGPNSPEQTIQLGTLHAAIHERSTNAVSTALGLPGVGGRRGNEADGLAPEITTAFGPRPVSADRLSVSLVELFAVRPRGGAA